MRFAGSDDWGDNVTRRKLVILLILVVVAVAVATPLIIAGIPTGPAPTKANLDKVLEGMTMPEVEAILGHDRILGYVSGSLFSMSSQHDWVASDGARASVTFSGGIDSTFRVCSKEWTPSNETIAEKVQRWVRLSRK